MLANGLIRNSNKIIFDFKIRMLLCNCTMEFILNCIVYIVVEHTSNMHIIFTYMYLAIICFYIFDNVKINMQNVMLQFIYYLLIRIRRNYFL